MEGARRNPGISAPLEDFLTHCDGIRTESSRPTEPSPDEVGRAGVSTSASGLCCSPPVFSRMAAILLILLATTPIGAQEDPGLRPDGERAAGPDVDACTMGHITAIEVQSRSIYDPEGAPYRAVGFAYELANALHVNTRESFIQRELLFEEGDCLDPFLLSESERLLDQYGFLTDASVSSRADGNGGHIVVVTTRDEWSTKVDLGFTYDEGANVEKLQVTEENFLGHGVFGEFTYLNRRETRTHSFGVSTPRFFGRSDAGIAWGKSRSGHFFDQHLRYPFVGEAGSWAVRQGYRRGTDFFGYATGGMEQFTRLLVPVFRENAEFSIARRFGDPGASVIVGASLVRDVVRFDDPAQVTLGSGYDDRALFEGTAPESMLRQWRGGAATRLGVHLGTRRFHYRDYVGLDGVRDHQTVGLGLFAGVSLARGLPMLAPTGVERLEDWVARSHVSFSAPVGSSLLHGGTTWEARYDAGGWRDVLGSADLVFYGRSRYLPGQTWFARASFGGGWKTETPYQLSLGGREAVRALAEDQLPGGRMVLFVLEDRIAFPWPSSKTMDLGATVFGEAGRMLPGDVPYGVDSGWQGSVGFGLRIGLPPGTRNIWRADVVFPVGSAGESPMFRLTFELNKFRLGFFNPEVRRSYWFGLGPETF